MWSWPWEAEDKSSPCLWNPWASSHLGLLQLGLQIGHVQVAVAVLVGFAKTDAIDDGGMVQLI